MKPFALILAVLLLINPLASYALTLGEGLNIVTEKGRDVSIARSGEEAAKANIALAKSPRLPWVDVYGRETWLRYQPESKLPFNVPGAPNSIPVSQDQFLTYGVKATQLLYDFGKTSSAIDAAKYRLKSSESETRGAKSRAALDFIMAYLDLLEADKLLFVAKEEVQRYEAHRKDAEARFNAGVITRNEVLQADVTLADSRQRLLTAENTRSLRESRINSLLLRPLNDAVNPQEIESGPASGLTLEEAWAGAEMKPGIRVLDARIAAKEDTIKAVEAEYLPVFYASGGYEYSENRYMVHDDNWSAVVGVNINLSSGGASSSRLDAERAELRSLKISRDKLLDTFRLNVKSAYLDLQSSQQKIEVSKTAVEQAKENLRLQRLRYKEGVGTATDVIDAVALLTTAETNTWKALYGVERSEAAFLDAADKDLVEIYTK